MSFRSSARTRLVNLPGFAKEDVKAELKDGYLTVTASHNTENEEKNESTPYLTEKQIGRILTDIGFQKMQEKLLNAVKKSVDNKKNNSK